MSNSIFVSLLEILGADEQSRVEVIKKRWEAYYGKMAKPLKVRLGDTDDNIRLNYARMIVDKGVSFLFGKGVEFQLDEETQTPAEDWLQECLDQNRMTSLMQNIALTGGVTGHVFIKLVTEPDKLPRLVVLDPETVTVSLAPDDAEKVLSYTITYASKDPKTGKPIGVRQVIEPDGTFWKITDQVGDLQSLHWRTVNEERWLHEFAPIVHCQNLPAPGEFWGTSDLEDDILEIVQSINFVASNTGRIIRFHAHPKTWGRGFLGKDLKVGIDETIILPGDNAELRNLEMQSDLASSLSFITTLRQALSEISRVPEVAAGNLDRIGALSGVALEIMYQPMLEKTGTKRLLYGDMLTELYRRLLAIGGFGDDNLPVLVWPQILPRDPMQERQAALIDQQLGVSRDTLLTRLGYNPELEKDKRAEEVTSLGEQVLKDFDNGKEG